MARPARFAALSLSPSLLIAAVYTLKVLTDPEPQVGSVAPMWMMCYGTGVYAAGLFSVRLPRMLGLAFIVTGAAGLLWFSPYGLALAALSFGLLHVLFGIAVAARTRRNGET
jgi:hypothetical protein